MSTQLFDTVFSNLLGGEVVEVIKTYRTIGVDNPMSNISVVEALFSLEGDSYTIEVLDCVNPIVTTMGSRVSISVSSILYWGKEGPLEKLMFYACKLS